MHQAETPAAATIGTIGAVTTSDTPTALNVDEYATSDAGKRTGFPRQTGQSLSYWLQGVRCDPLLDHRSTEELPSEADTVIIGSGLTGTMVAKEHLKTFPGKSVVVLEAREFCSGATGRNAGHCKPDQWRGFAKYEKAFGAEKAKQILDNEQETWEKLVAYVKEENVDCDLWVGDTLDVAVDTEVANLAMSIFKQYKAAGGKVDHIKVYDSPAEAAKISQIKSAQAVWAWQASTLYPWKLTAHIMRQNIAQGINLQTYTTVRRVDSGPDGTWIVRSDRGDIKCRNVVHATNAYSAAIEPGLRGVIRPTPHMCNKVVPPACFSGSKALRNSYGVLLPNGALFSINPRCTADGIVLFGGSNPGQVQLDQLIDDEPERCIDDGLTNVQSVTKAVKDFAESDFEGWSDAVPGPGQLYDYSWSGIIGRSADGVPYIGELPGKKGQWLCAGHHGHGMARIFTAAPGLVKLMSGEPYSATGLPAAYELTPTRLKAVQEAPSFGKVAII